MISYLSGALMFSYWLGKLKGIDIRKVGDGNPGVANAWKSGGWTIGIPAILLDAAKGFIPVFIAYRVLNINDYSLVPIAAAPLCGHAFPPFLSFRGGKSIIPTFGIWIALTFWKIPTTFGLILLFFKFRLKIKNDAINTIGSMFSILIFLIFSNFSTIMILIFIVNTGIILIKHWKDININP